MELNLKYENGQTPIDEDEKSGLKIKSLSTMKELDEFEQQNIEDAMQWVHGRSFESKPSFECRLHLERSQTHVQKRLEMGHPDQDTSKTPKMIGHLEFSIYPLFLRPFFYP